MQWCHEHDRHFKDKQALVKAQKGYFNEQNVDKQRKVTGYTAAKLLKDEPWTAGDGKLFKQRRTYYLANDIGAQPYCYCD